MIQVVMYIFFLIFLMDIFPAHYGMTCTSGKLFIYTSTIFVVGTGRRALSFIFFFLLWVCVCVGGDVHF